MHKVVIISCSFTFTKDDKKGYFFMEIPELDALFKEGWEFRNAMPVIGQASGQGLLTTHNVIISLYKSS